MHRQDERATITSDKSIKTKAKEKCKEKAGYDTT